ncbi:DMT family transporter [Dehalogenimonas sp. THU2]|uniref:DMT family transporter n=1 Tax=Dehalogenimonas sp. THU2 TaxID=3151121 RepID=UPI0032185763
MTDWVIIAVIGTVAVAGVNIIDSHLIGRRMPSLRAFLVPVSAVVLIFALATMVLFPLPENIGMGPLLAAVGAGIIRAVSVGLLLNIFRTEEVSWAIPVYHTYPVFVALMAVPLLGETLAWLHWLAIAVIVGGTVVLSAQRGAGGGIKWRGRPIMLLVTAALLSATADVLSKYALGEISFWNMYWIGSLCLVTMYFAFSLRPAVIRQLLALPQRGRTAVLIMLNEALAMAGILLVFNAMASGPVSLVSAITGSRPIFVFFLALLMNRLVPGFLLRTDTGRRANMVRLAATMMIACGIAIIYLA